MRTADSSWGTAILENGLRLVTIPMPSAQSVCVNVFVGMGSRSETPETSGLSHFLEHMVAKGTARRPSTVDVARAIEGVGGVFNAFTRRELTWYFDVVPFDKLPLAVDVLADLLQHPRLDADELERERKVVGHEIRQARDQPMAQADQLLHQACFGDEPLGRPVMGALDTIRELPRDEFLRCMSAGYVARNMVVVVAGNADHAAVETLVRDLFRNLNAGAPLAVAPADADLPRRRVVVESRDIGQSRLAIGARAVSHTDADRHVVAILSAVLGSGLSSRLFREVRERRRLAYDVSSTHARFADTGIFTVPAGVSPTRVTETAQVIVDELDKLMEQPVSDEELLRARDFSTGTFRLRRETPIALGRFVGRRLLLTGETETIDDVVRGRQAVTAGDVQRVARRLFRRENLAISVVGPNPPEDQLAALIACS